jgi:hypothetical protein
MPIRTRPLSRSLYLCMLALLQLALAAHVAPALARTFKAHALFASLHDGWPAAAHLGGLALAIVGAAIALQFPLLALARHAKRGPLRFLGLPPWATHVGLAGAVVFALALVGAAIVALDPGVREVVAPVVQSAATAGTATMAAGALCAEMLRRSVPPAPFVAAPRRAGTAKAETIDATA